MSTVHCSTMASYDVDNPEVVNFITQSPDPEKVATRREGIYGIRIVHNISLVGHRHQRVLL